LYLEKRDEEIEKRVTRRLVKFEWEVAKRLKESDNEMVKKYEIIEKKKKETLDMLEIMRKKISKEIKEKQHKEQLEQDYELKAQKRVYINICTMIISVVSLGYTLGNLERHNYQRKELSEER
jgi:peroxiredoxin family protein